MVGIGFPGGRFAASRDDDTGSICSLVRFGFDCGREVHEEGYRTQDTLGMVDQANEFSQRSFATKVEDAAQGRMIMMRFTNLDKRNFIFEMVDNNLPTAEMPPFDRKIKLAAGDNDPVGQVWPERLLYGRWCAPFKVGDVNISLYLRGADGKAELFIKELDVAVNEVDGTFIGGSDEGILAIDYVNFRIAGIERSNVWVIVPKLGAAGADICKIAARITGVEVSYGGREHHNITRRLEASENQFLHLIQSEK